MPLAPFDSEMESFFDFEQGFHSPSMSRSPTSAFGPSDTIDPMAMMNGHAPERQAFSGPSFEYSSFKQLTGLPTGAVSNVSAFNDIHGDGLFDLTSPNPMSIRMNYTPTINFDMDFDTLPQEPLPAYFFPTDAEGLSDLLSPSTAGGLEVPNARSNGRLWPGMHSQQAEQQKADALAKQQRHQQMGQQIMQQKQQLSRSSSSRQSISRQGGLSTPSTSDANVDDRISRLLDQMRHNSTVSTIDEDAASSAGDNGSRSAKMRKEEEDMDEDERLLASDEGKKLSSKERRQLRNKVSARAFRSRRKEYIGQLEGELAVKANECNELKARNRNLMDQNEQLTRLTQTLLRHPAFNTFLNDMSNDPSILDGLPSQTSSSSQQSDETLQIPKEEPTSQSHDLQANMAMMPQTSLDFSMMNLGTSHWNAGMGFNFHQPQVFSVLELPQPSLEHVFKSLSGKSERETMCDDAPKLLAPKLERPSFLEDAAVDLKPIEVNTQSFSVTGLDPEEFALYLDETVATSSASFTPVSQPSQHLRRMFDSKSHIAYRLVVATQVDEAASLKLVNNMFDSLLATSRRIEELTSHLPI